MPAAAQPRPFPGLPPGPAGAAAWAGALAILLAALFWGAFGETARLWKQPENSHGYLIPFLAAYLFLIRAQALAAAPPRPVWGGIAALLVAMLALLAGQLSALFIIQQYAFILTLWALALTLLGPRGARVVWASLAMLIFLVPLPSMLQVPLSTGLQFMSTDLAALVLRNVGVPVYVEGNVIDMGVSKLQVVEACSGLRYLFPLLSFGFLCAYVYRGPSWQRVLLLASTVPITIVMNSIRIAITGILYDNYGIGAGDSFLHFFEGWVIFCGCLAILFGEMWVLARQQGRGLDDVFDPQLPGLADLRALAAAMTLRGPPAAVLPLLAASLAVVLAVTGRSEVIPTREPFVGFPLRLGEWRGEERSLGSEELAELRLTDYALADFSSPDGAIVNFYAAYYASQRSGASVHSPRACLPGGGWQIRQNRVVELPGVLPDGSALPVNELIIGMGDRRQLVNYWFPQRGRNLTSEYTVKWYIFWDSLTRQRTDGAMVRLVTPLGDPRDDDAARARLLAFMRALHGRLAYYLPPAEALPMADGAAPVLPSP